MFLREEAVGMMTNTLPYVGVLENMGSKNNDAVTIRVRVYGPTNLSISSSGVHITRRIHTYIVNT